MDTPTLAAPGLPPVVSLCRRKERPAPDFGVGSGPLPSIDAVPTPSIRSKRVGKVSGPISRIFAFARREISGGESVTQVDVAVMLDSCTTVARGIPRIVWLFFSYYSPSGWYAMSSPPITEWKDQERLCQVEQCIISNSQCENVTDYFAPLDDPNDWILIETNFGKLTSSRTISDDEFRAG